MYYEHKKHDGSLPLIGVNTFLPKEHAGEVTTQIELIRSTEAEKQQQIANVANYVSAHMAATHASTVPASAPLATATELSTRLKHLQETARRRENVFAALIESVKSHSLGQISHALYDVGGEYRRNM